MQTIETKKSNNTINKDSREYVDVDLLRNFIEDVFVKLNVSHKDSKIIADVIISSDLRGIESHGIQRLKTYYDRILKGIYNPITKIDIITESPTTAVLDGNCSMGHVTAYKAMKIAIKKARKYGIGAVAVRNSTHFGIAGYYSLMAIKEGMLGIVTTNATPAVPPTFGIEPMLGTNPLAAGAPTDENFPFLIDCATSIIQKGKVELYNRENRFLPEGVVLDHNGNSERDPCKIMDEFKNYQAALMPIGGEGGKASGYKGYGLSTLMEILSSSLQQGVSLKETAGIEENGKTYLKVGHFFLAMNIENFIPLNQFKNNTGRIMRALRKSKKAPGKNQIFTAGEKEYISELKRLKKGIPINKSIQNDIKFIQKELGLEKYNFEF